MTPAKQLKINKAIQLLKQNDYIVAEDVYDLENQNNDFLVFPTYHECREYIQEKNDLFFNNVSDLIKYVKDHDLIKDVVNDKLSLGEIFTGIIL